MKVIQILTMNQQIQHVVTLSANLKTNLHPVQSGGLKELCCFEGAEQVPKSNQSIKLVTIKKQTNGICTNS